MEHTLWTSERDRERVGELRHTCMSIEVFSSCSHSTLCIPNRRSARQEKGRCKQDGELSFMCLAHISLSVSTFQLESCPWSQGSKVAARKVGTKREEGGEHNLRCATLGSGSIERIVFAQVSCFFVLSPQV